MEHVRCPSLHHHSHFVGRSMEVTLHPDPRVPGDFGAVPPRRGWRHDRDYRLEPFPPRPPLLACGGAAPTPRAGGGDARSPNVRQRHWPLGPASAKSGSWRKTLGSHHSRTCENVNERAPCGAGRLDLAGPNALKVGSRQFQLQRVGRNRLDCGLANDRRRTTCTTVAACFPLRYARAASDRLTAVEGGG
jgi:hypothetical protein